eukprot:GHVL01009040.1.p1 GENE.GHVL01009040.1~~GHVL01009040.1.p1  ORF type:complete len:427 (+),score=40.92 GHVL01009040.1:42-1322(+)
MLIIYIFLYIYLYINCCYGRKASGSFLIDEKNPFVFVSKFGYQPGDGKYKVHAKRTKAEVEDKVEKIRLVVFIDTKWSEIESMEMCQRPKNARASKSIVLPANGKWSEQIIGFLSQRMRPYVWYFAFDNCDGELTNGTRVRWEAEFTQASGSHFSVEHLGTLTTTGVELILYFLFLILYLRGVYAHMRECGKIHPMIVGLNVAIGFQIVSIAARFVHLYIFTQNGMGIKPLDVLAQLFAMMSQITITSLLLLISLGFTILHSKLAKLEHTLPMVLFIMVIVHVLLVVIAKIKDDTSYKFHETEGFAGWLIVGARITVFCWFIKCVKNTTNKASIKQIAFLHRFTIFSTFYFLTYPTVHIIAALVLAPYVRHQVISVVVCVCQMASIAALSTLFLTKSEYFQVSTFSDTMLPSAMTLMSMGSRGRLE